MGFESILVELRQLQTELQGAADRLWSVRSELADAYRQGYREDDFLPRRLMTLRSDAENRFKETSRRLNLVVSTRLGRALIPFSSADDLKHVAEIHRTIRTLRNAFASELGLGGVLARLQQSIPSASLHS